MPPAQPVVRAEGFYLPPQHLPATAWDLVPEAERVVRWYEEKASRRLPVTSTTLTGQDRWARIDAGRWVADCVCGSAQVVTPTDPRMWCVECGTGWWPLAFPADVTAAETAVAALPVHEQFWWQPDDPVLPPPPPPPALEVPTI